MPEYTFSLLNHLEETFDTRTLHCRDEDHALECGRSLLALGYPVLVRRNGVEVTILQPSLNEFNSWLRALIAPAASVLAAGRR